MVDDPVLVQETNNTVVWLRPHEIIAKVGTWAHSEEALRREHAVATILAAAGAPIAPPVRDAEPVLDEHTGFLVTLWQRLEHDAAREPSPVDVAGALRRLHEGLSRYRGELPSFREGVRRARATLDDDRLMVALAPEDRSTLRRAYDRISAELEALDLVEASASRGAAPRQPPRHDERGAVGRPGGGMRRTRWNGMSPSFPKTR